MTKDILDRAIVLRAEIEQMETFLRHCKISHNIRFYKKKKGVVCEVHNYTMERKIYEISPRLRDKFIAVVEQELEELKKEFDKIGKGDDYEIL